MKIEVNSTRSIENKETVTIPISFNIEETDTHFSIRGVLPYGTINGHGERLVRGCFTNSLKNNKIVVLGEHRNSLAIPNLSDEEDGLHFEASIPKGVQYNDELLIKLRNGLMSNLSYGFYYVRDGYKWNDTDECLDLLNIDLREVSILEMPSDTEAKLREAPKQKEPDTEEQEQEYRTLAQHFMKREDTFSKHFKNINK